MLSRFRRRRWLLAWVVLRLVCFAPPVAMAADVQIAMRPMMDAANPSTVLHVAGRMAAEWGRAAGAEGRGRTLARARAGTPRAWLAAFVSPLDARRIAVLPGASRDARVSQVTSDIVDPVTRPGARGDYFLKTSTDRAFHASGRPRVSDAPPVAAANRWYAGPLGLLILVTGFGLMIMVLAAVAQAVHHCLRPGGPSMSTPG